MSFLKNNIFLIFLLTFATLFSILYQGYHFAESDQAYFLAYLKKVVDPELYKNDLLMDTLVVFFPGYLWHGIAIVYKFVNLEILLLFLHIFFRFLFFLAIFLIGFHVSRRREVGYLATLFWTTSKPSPAYDVFANNFIQSQFSLPLVLLSSFFFLKKKLLLAFLILIVSFYAHPAVTAPMLAIFFLTLIFSRKILTFVVYTLLLLVLLYPFFLKVTKIITMAGEYDTFWLELMKIRNPHHFLASSWPIDSWIPFLYISLLLVVAFIFERKRVKDKIFNFFILSQYLIFILAVFFTDIMTFPRLITYSPFHIGTFFPVFPSVMITMFLYSLIINKNLKIQVLGIVTSYFFFFNQYSLSFSKSFMIFAPVITVLFLFLRQNWKILFTSILVILFLWMPYMFYKYEIKKDEYASNWIEIQKWAKVETLSEDSFIIPIYLSGFRFYSERPQVVNWEDGGTGFYARGYMKKWWARIKEFGLTFEKHDLESQKYLYTHLSEKKVLDISKKYEASYFITESKSPYSFENVFSNDIFIVYKVR